MATTTTTETAELLLPEFFPLAPRACGKVANKFFDCFSEKGVQPDDAADPDAGRKALVDCATTLAAYEKCMTRWRSRNEPIFYRVQEEYRPKPPPSSA